MLNLSQSVTARHTPTLGGDPRTLPGKFGKIQVRIGGLFVHSSTVLHDSVARPASDCYLQETFMNTVRQLLGNTDKDKNTYEEFISSRGSIVAGIERVRIYMDVSHYLRINDVRTEFQRIGEVGAKYQTKRKRLSTRVQREV